MATTGAQRRGSAGVLIDSVREMFASRPLYSREEIIGHLTSRPSLQGNGDEGVTTEKAMHILGICVNGKCVQNYGQYYSSPYLDVAEKTWQSVREKAQIREDVWSPENYVTVKVGDILEKLSEEGHGNEDTKRGAGDPWKEYAVSFQGGGGERRGNVRPRFDASSWYECVNRGREFFCILAAAICNETPESPSVWCKEYLDKIVAARLRFEAVCKEREKVLETSVDSAETLAKLQLSTANLHLGRAHEHLQNYHLSYSSRCIRNTELVEDIGRESGRERRIHLLDMSLSEVKETFFEVAEDVLTAAGEGDLILPRELLEQGFSYVGPRVSVAILECIFLFLEMTRKDTDAHWITSSG